MVILVIGMIITKISMLITKTNMIITKMSMITNMVIFSRPIRSIKTLPEGEEEDSKRGTKQITSVNTAAADIL